MKNTHTLHKHIHDNKKYLLVVVALASLVVFGSSFFVQKNRVSYNSNAQSLAFAPWSFGSAIPFWGRSGSFLNDQINNQSTYRGPDDQGQSSPSKPNPTTPKGPDNQGSTPPVKNEPTIPSSPENRFNTPTKSPRGNPPLTRHPTSPTNNANPTSKPTDPPSNNVTPGGPSYALQPSTNPGGNSGGNNKGGKKTTPTPMSCQATQLPQNLSATCVNSTTIRYSWTPKDTTTIISVNKWENDEGAVDFQKEFPVGTSSWDLTGLDPNGTYTYWASAKNACGELKGFTYGNTPPLKCGVSSQGQFSIVKSRPDLDIACNGRKLTYLGDTVSFTVRASSSSPNSLERAEVWLGQYNLSPWTTGCPAGMTLTPNSLWCKMADITMSGVNFSKTITWTPDREGKFYVMIKGKESGNALMCSGNPQCTFNSPKGTIDCTQTTYYGGAYDCGAEDSLVVDVSKNDGSCSSVSVQSGTIKEGDALIVKWTGLPLGQGTGGLYGIGIFYQSTGKAVDISSSGIDISVSDKEPSGSKLLQFPATILKAGTYDLRILNGSTVLVKSAPFTVVAASNLAPSMIHGGALGAIVQGDGFDVAIRNYKTTSEIVLQRTDLSPKPAPEVGIEGYLIGDTCKTEVGCKMTFTTSTLMPVGTYELQLLNNNAVVSTIPFTLKKASPRCPTVSFSCANLVNDGKSGGLTTITIDNKSYIGTDSLTMVREYPDGSAYDSLDTPPTVDVSLGKFSTNLIGIGNIHLFPPNLVMDDCKKIAVPAQCQTYPTPTPTSSPNSTGGSLTVSPTKYTMTNITDSVKVSWQNISGITALDNIELYKFKSTQIDNPIASQVITFSWGSVTFFLPKNLPAGSYEFRYYNNGLGLGGRKLMAKTGEFVVSGQAGTPTATNTPQPAFIESVPTALDIPYMGRKTIKVIFGSPQNAYYVSLYSPGSSPKLVTETYISGTSVDGGATSGTIDFPLPVPGIDSLSSGVYTLKLFGDKQNKLLLATSQISLTIGTPTQPPTPSPKPTIQTVYPGGVVIDIGQLRSFDFYSQNSSIDLSVGYLPADPSQFEWRLYNAQNTLISSYSLSPISIGTIMSSTSIAIPITKPVGTYELRLVNRSTGAVPPLKSGAYSYGYPLPDGSKPTDARLVLHIIQTPQNAPTSTPVPTNTVAPTATPTPKPIPQGFAFSLVGVNFTSVGGNFSFVVTVPSSPADYEVRVYKKTGGAPLFSHAICSTVLWIFGCNDLTYNTSTGLLPSSITQGVYSLKLYNAKTNTEIHSIDVEIR